MGRFVTGRPPKVAFATDKNTFYQRHCVSYPRNRQRRFQDILSVFEKCKGLTHLPLRLVFPGGQIFIHRRVFGLRSFPGSHGFESIWFILWFALVLVIKRTMDLLLSTTTEWFRNFFPSRMSTPFSNKTDSYSLMIASILFQRVNTFKSNSFSKN